MDSPRERRERAEELLVCSRGVRARESAGRPRPEPECEVRTCFQRDRGCGFASPLKKGVLTQLWFRGILPV